MPYFPLVVVFCQRYVRQTGIGTVVAMMLPYSVGFLAVWTAFLIGYWAVGLPLGLESNYRYGPWARAGEVSQMVESGSVRRERVLSRRVAGSCDPAG